MSDIVMGKDCVLAYFPAASFASPTYAEIENAKDVSQPGVTKNSVSLASRGSAGWDLKGAGLRSMDLQFSYLYEAGDAVGGVLRDSFLNDTDLGFAVLSGPANGTFPAGITPYDVEGWKFVGQVLEFATTEDLEDAKMIDVKVEASFFKLNGSLMLPTWVTISGSNGSGS
ncbi:MAG: hypothetical protein AAF958_14210 [Planctomycetota bacterium]